jgi:hypothetical protein
LHLRQLLAKQFGPSSEKIHPDQLQLFAEAVQAVIAEETASTATESEESESASGVQDKEKQKQKLYRVETEARDAKMSAETAADDLAVVVEDG